MGERAKVSEFSLELGEGGTVSVEKVFMEF